MILTQSYFDILGYIFGVELCNTSIKLFLLLWRIRIMYKNLHAAVSFLSVVKILVTAHCMQELIEIKPHLDFPAAQCTNYKKYPRSCEDLG